MRFLPEDSQGCYRRRPPHLVSRKAIGLSGQIGIRPDLDRGCMFRARAPRRRCDAVGQWISFETEADKRGRGTQAISLQAS